MKNYALIVLSILSLTGCASLQEPSHRVVGQTIISEDYPPADIAIDSSFSYEGSGVRYAVGGGHATTTSSTGVKNTVFSFWDQSNKDSQRVIIVQFLRLTKHGWNYQREPEITGSGVVEDTVTTPMGEMESYSRFISETGLFSEDSEERSCGVGSIIRHIPSGMRRHKLRITYVEEFDCSTISQFRYGNDSLTPAGRRRLDEALGNAMRSLAFKARE